MNKPDLSSAMQRLQDQYLAVLKRAEAQYFADVKRKKRRGHPKDFGSMKQEKGKSNG